MFSQYIKIQQGAQCWIRKFEEEKRALFAEKQWNIPGNLLFLEKSESAPIWESHEKQGINAADAVPASVDFLYAALLIPYIAGD